MKSLLRAFAGLASHVPQGARLILVSHDISSSDEDTFTPGNSTPPELFSRQLRFLKDRFRFVSLPELFSDKDPGPLATLTFDDGFRTVHSRAAGILQKEEVPFTVFCNGLAIREGRLNYGKGYEPVPFGKTRFYLDENEVRSLHTSGTGIGSHGTSHQPLSEAEPGELEAEVSGNKKYLEGITGSPVIDFAFPFGKPRHINTAAVNACLSAGHERLYSAIPRYVRDRDLVSKEKLIPRASLHLQQEADLHVLLNRLWLGGSA